MPTLNLGKPGMFDAFAGDERMKELQRRYGIDPSMGSGNFGDYAQQARGIGVPAQADAMKLYRDQALGQGPSVAREMWQQQAGRNMTDALALANRGRGGNIAGAQQQALASNAYAQQQTNQGMAALRAQEQQAGMAGYAGMAGQVAGQGLAYDQLGMQAALAGAQNRLGWYQADRGMDLQQNAQSWGRTMDALNMGAKYGQMIGGAMSGGMGAGLMSDERSKQNMQPTTLSASEAVGQTTPMVYNYRPGYGPSGVRFGPTAQDLEANPMTASLVQEGPDGLKRVDAGGLAALTTAATAEQEGRIRQLEQRIGGGQYQPDADIDFGSRMAAGRANGPWNIPSRQPMQTIDPFGEQRGSSGLGQYLSDERAKANIRPTTIDPFSGPVRGNVDLRAQPKVRNSNGSVSTVDSRSYGLAGEEVVLPSVTPDGRHLRDDAAILDEYRRTGRHLGKFGTVPEAEAAARRIHADYESGRYQGRTPSPFGPRNGYEPRAVPISSNAPVRSGDLYAPGDAHSFSMPYVQGELADRVEGADLRSGHPVVRHGETRYLPMRPELSPREQALVDMANDVLDRSTYVDEAGVRRARATFLPEGSQLFMPRAERRFLAEEAQREREEQLRQLVPPAPAPYRGRRITDPRAAGRAI